MHLWVGILGCLCMRLSFVPLGLILLGPCCHAFALWLFCALHCVSVCCLLWSLCHLRALVLVMWTRFHYSSVVCVHTAVICLHVCLFLCISFCTCCTHGPHVCSFFGWNLPRMSRSLHFACIGVRCF